MISVMIGVAVDILRVIVIILVQFARGGSIRGVAIGHRGTKSASARSSSAMSRRRVHLSYLPPKINETTDEEPKFVIARLRISNHSSS